ncbi:hypothetical protein ABZ671_11770 [Micromonospora sp. NPDC006766]|uniref:hypothetical protein n=1 Tax=Micromonospora sp. NPDC006766 TaxID=3154778 RepID=UPI0033E7ADAE
MQQGTYRLLRHRIAFATIGLAALVIMFFDGDSPRSLWPWYVATIVGGVFGASSFVVHEPRPRRYVLALALVFAVVGLAGGMFVAKMEAGR